MIEVFFLSFGLAMDAFAVSVGIGSNWKSPDWKKRFLVAGYFGSFQAFMPLIGSLAGIFLSGWIGEVDHWIAFFLLSIIGVHMFYEGFQDESTRKVSCISHEVLFSLAVATSIDALAAGFTLPFLTVPFYISITIIGVITSVLSLVGIELGSRMGTWLEGKAELFGGAILIGIGVKILLEHTGWI